MNFKIRSLAPLPVIVLLPACRKLFPALSLLPTHTTEDENLPENPSSFHYSSVTPARSYSSLASNLSPRPVPSPVLTAPPISTVIAINALWRIFKDLLSIINDIYVYPDFNGLDRFAMHEKYHRIISAGLNIIPDETESDEFFDYLIDNDPAIFTAIQYLAG